MGEHITPESEPKPSFSIAGQFAEWYEQMADRVDLHALEMQARIMENPALIEDPTFIAETSQLQREKDLLERLGKGASDETFGLEVESLLGTLAVGEANED